jgi:glyoxylase-like metal-dependent hydrolase (beta-lactamase superfamily II)
MKMSGDNKNHNPMINQVFDKIYKIELPLDFPFSFKATNIYFIDDKPRTLVDTGIKTDLSLETLKKGLKEIGLGLESIERILITHAHRDHYGQAKMLSSLYGAKIYIHSEEQRKTQNVSQLLESFKSKLLKNGVPEDLVNEVLRNFRSTEKLAEPLDDVSFLKDGDLINFKSMNWQVIECPGHSPNLLCFYWEEGRVLFTTDHLLKNIIPPALCFPEYDSNFRYSILRKYLATLEKVERMDVSLILPGHGEEIRDAKELIQKVFTNCENRRKKILSTLSRRGKTPYEIAVELFFENSPYRVSFGKTPEVLGYLEILREEGKVRLEEKGGKDYYSLT